MTDCSKIILDADGVYENDLALAAELGKALLEKNRELELQVVHLQQISNEYRLENDHLNRQLEILKEMNDSRMHVYEELDRNASELEAINRQLRQEIETNCLEIQRLTKKSKQLESDLDVLQSQMDEVRALEVNRLKEDKRKTQSVPSIQDAVTMEIRNVYRKAGNWSTYAPSTQIVLPKNPYEYEIEKLKKDISQTKAKLSIERSKNKIFETDFIEIVQDNQSLEARLRELQDKMLELQSSEKSRVKSVSHELCAKCAQELQPPVCFSKEIEHDDPQVGSNGKFVKLGDGGSIYGSDESINKVVSESGELVITQEELTHGIPILNELDAQYNALISKYENLISNMTKRASGDFGDVEITPDVDNLHKEVQTLINSNKTQQHPKPASPTPSIFSQTENISHSRCSQPTYKYLFKDIYATLEKSHTIQPVPVYATTSQRSPNSSNQSSPIKHPT